MARITISFMREIEMREYRGEISYSRMVELLNEKAAEPESLWASGQVTCDLCSHEWIAVRPAETKMLECPNCGNIGTFTTPEDNDNFQQTT